MLSFGLPQVSHTVAAWAAAATLALLAAPCEAAESGDDEPFLGQIQEILSRDGPYSIDLLEPLTRLAVLYRESDDLSFALASLEQAVQILRVNRGLHTLDQVPLVRQIIRIEEARGNAEGAWDRQQDLLALLRRYPHDLRIVPVLRELADEEMKVLNEFIDHEKPPEVVFGCFYQEWPGSDAGDCHAGSRRTVVQGLLAEAQRNYADAIGVLLHHGLYDSEELRELELDLLRGVDLLRSLYDSNRSYPPPMVPGFLGASSIEPWRSRIAPIAALAQWKARQLEVSAPPNSGNSATKHVRLMSPYHRGRESLRRLYQYDTASGRPLVSQVESLVRLADWDLLYSRNGRAVDAYAAAYRMLEQAGASPSSIERLFAPPTPVVLPAFQPNPLANDAGQAGGYVDVAFEITRYGRARAIEVRRAENAAEGALDRLVGIVKSSRFRPRVTDGAFSDTAPVLVRYYVRD